MKYVCFLFIFMFYVSSCYSQNAWKAKSDSIYTHILKMKADTNKVLALLQYGWFLERYDMDSAASCYIKMQQLSQRLNYINGEIKYYGNYTFILNQQGNYKKSLQLNLESVKFAKQKGNKEHIATCLFNTGSSYNNMANYNEAISYYLQAVKVFEELKLTKNIAVAYDNVGGVFANIGQYKKAITYHLLALESATELHDSSEMTTAMLNLSTAYKNLNNYTEAETYASKSLQFSKAINSTYLEINSNLTLAEIFVNQQLFDKSILYAKQGLQRSEEIKSAYSKMEALKILTHCYFSNNDYANTITIGEQSIVFGKQNNITSELHKIYAILAEAYAKNENYALGYKNLIISKHLKDSINEKHTTKEIEQLEIKYQTEKKEKQILALQHTKNRQQLFIGILLLGLIIVLLFIYLIFKNYKQKQKILETDALYKQQRIQELEIEQRLIVSQSIIKGQEDERTRLAKDLHDGLGSILSSAKYAFSKLKSSLIITNESSVDFENGLTILDQSIRELRSVAHNMMPEVLVKFGLHTALQDLCDSINKNSTLHITYQSFDFEDSDVPKHKILTIYRIIQELITNILKHAEAKTALVQFIKTNTTLSITVEDDGKGFDTTLLKNNGGIGYLNIHTRVAYINGKIDLQSAPSKGTSVHIDILNITHG